jgi:hypothetical protein
LEVSPLPGIVPIPKLAYFTGQHQSLDLRKCAEYPYLLKFASRFTA